MRALAAGLLVFVSACATAPRATVAHPVGHYTCAFGHDGWNELELRDDGSCTWWECRAFVVISRRPSHGHWRTEDGQVQLTIDEPSPWWLPVLTPRAWQGHVYLVPKRDLAWFDQHGPMYEFCFHVEGAPLRLHPFAEFAF